MIKSDLQHIESELNEVISLFEDVEKLNIKHIFAKKEDRVVNTFVFVGKSFAYGNLMPKNLSEIEEKRLIKRFAKLSLYKALSRFYEKEMPWGSLTGIRPTKLAYSQLESTGEFEEFFIDTMKVSKEKTQLVKNVLNTQKGIYKKDDNNTDFFVFIPFCPSRCKYCSFITNDIEKTKAYVDEYVNALIEEIRHSAKYIKNLRSIYVGGGTPVSLDNKNLEKVLKELAKINTGVEFSVEAGRPDAITKENLKLLKDYGVNRICVNPQTFNNKTLQLLGRNHTAEQVIDVYNLTKDDFSVNMDLIAGLEKETFSDFKYSLDTALSLSPDNITVHTLCVKKGSYLSAETNRLSANEVNDMVDYAYNELTKNGYAPYYLYRQKYMAGNLENVGYTKPGKACVYNVDVMEEISQNVACGANAISKRVFNGGERIERCASPKDILTYLKNIEKIKSNKDKLFV
ncbi:MAG: coproporphyrinogen dehydrogenase HemZ [Clostridia bacterium]|nr:coproporphyrinogen dehydrogenase HemZ [Clostridia bacterium]